MRSAICNKHYQDCRLAGLWTKDRAKQKDQHDSATSLAFTGFYPCLVVAQKQVLSWAGTRALGCVPGGKQSHDKPGLGKVLVLLCPLIPGTPDPLTAGDRREAPMPLLRVLQEWLPAFPTRAACWLQSRLLQGRQSPFAHKVVYRCMLRSPAWAQSTRILISSENPYSYACRPRVCSQYHTW